MIKIIINDKIVIVNTKYITHVELSSNNEIEIGTFGTHNIYIERSEVPNVIVEVDDRNFEDNEWGKIIKALIFKK